ncbi:hypothetical protein M1349_00965 [Patescibacteria group bacterium]|nr:hypothetical protein [Patescibacteria group bacterium]
MEKLGIGEQALRSFPVCKKGEPSQPSFVMHGGISREAVPYLKKVLEKFGVSSETLQEYGDAETILSQFFSEDGVWKPKIEREDVDLFKMSPKKVNEFLTKRLKLVYEVIDPSLFGSKEHGFNPHGLNHAEFVATQVDVILANANYGEDVRRRAVIAARIHDLGNLFNRDLHFLFGWRMAKTLIPELVQEKPEFWGDLEQYRQRYDKWEGDQKQLRVIKRAVRRHEPKAVIAYLSGRGDREFKDSRETFKPYAVEIEGDYSTESIGLTADQMVLEMQRKLDPETLALIIADKIDIGQARLPDHEDAVRSDPHAVLNAFGKTVEFGYLMGILGAEGKLSFKMEFDPKPADDKIKSNPKLGAHVEPRNHPKPGETLKIKVPQLYRDMHTASEKGMPYIFVWSRDFWKHYRDRVILAIEASFALYKNAYTLDWIVNDPTSKNLVTKGGGFVGETFDRRELQASIDDILSKYNLHKDDQKAFEEYIS